MISGNHRRKRTKGPFEQRWDQWLIRRSEPVESESTSAPSAPSRSKDRSRSAKTSASYLAVLLLAVIAVTGAHVYHLNVRFEGVWLGYETSRARAERTRLLVERRELRLELASLKSPARVESEARERLGMEMPDHTRIIPIGKKLTPVLASGRAR